MSADGFKHHFIEAMAKHLPPSSSTLRLVDVGGQCGPILARRRSDIDVQTLDDVGAAGSIDAVAAYDIELADDLSARVLTMLRPGGRFIAVMPTGEVDKSWAEWLEARGYARILVEAAVDGLGLLIRGEKAHDTDDTWRRIQGTAAADSDLLDIRTFKGRYVHFLIRQEPNKPVWKLTAKDTIRWQALALQRGADKAVLGFSSLPKAVGFMQPAAVDGRIQGINKVGKFDKARAMAWAWDVILNPRADSIGSQRLAFVNIDPSTAEAPDE